MEEPKGESVGFAANFCASNKKSLLYVLSTLTKIFF